MPNVDVYLPEDVYSKLRTAAQTFHLTNRQLARAILCAAVSELERADGRILPADQADLPPPSKSHRQPAREGSGTP